MSKVQLVFNGGESMYHIYMHVSQVYIKWQRINVHIHGGFTDASSSSSSSMELPLSAY
jgi:hypothetical protein